jgi:hypothetical protein
MIVRDLSAEDFLKRNPHKRFASVSQHALFNELCRIFNNSNLDRGLGSGKTWCFEQFEQYMMDRLSSSK